MYFFPLSFDCDWVCTQKSSSSPPAGSTTKIVYRTSGSNRTTRRFRDSNIILLPTTRRPSVDISVSIPRHVLHSFPARRTWSKIGFFFHDANGQVLNSGFLSFFVFKSKRIHRVCAQFQDPRERPTDRPKRNTPWPGKTNIIILSFVSYYDKSLRVVVLHFSTT